MSINALLKGLNEPQREAVTHPGGPIMVIAGPGAGKTRVLTHRLAYLIHQGIPPYRLLALTFTNKAAREMKERVDQLLGQQVRDLWIGTFHSVFARLLRREGGRLGYEPDYSIYDTDDSRRLIATIIKDLKLDKDQYKDRRIQHRISLLKNAMITPDAYFRMADLVAQDETAGIPEFGKIYATYQKRLRAANAMDFDDLLLNMYLLLEHFPDVLYKYQHFFDHVLIDEFQDTNRVQYLIARKLVGVHENLFVVGDDAQSIYAFRGANIENIFAFQRDFPDHKLVRLEQNYRSTKTIVEAANNLIRHNERQIQKRLWTTNPPGEKIQLIKAANDDHEGRMVVGDIFERMMQHHLRPGQFAILYRTNAQSRPFEEALRRQGIPYRVYGSLAFYQRREIKDVIAYLKVVVNPHDDVSLLRIINFPPRGIGQTTIDRLRVYATQRGISIWEAMRQVERVEGLSQRSRQAVQRFVAMIEALRTDLEKEDAYTMASRILQRSGIVDFWKQKQAQEPEARDRLEHIDSLMAGIKDFMEHEKELAPDEDDTTPPLARFLQSISLMTDQDLDDDQQDAVKLMTLHAAKGLEFDHVYIVGLEEGLLPSFLSLNSPEEIEEERRLFYVGITRARHTLTLSFAQERYRHGRMFYPEPSRFIKELGNVVEPPLELIVGESEPAFPTADRTPTLRPYSHTNTVKRTQSATTVAFVPDDPLQVEKGMEIIHQKFGRGKVLDVSGQGQQKVALIRFEDAGTKKIMLRFAKLKILKS